MFRQYLLIALTVAGVSAGDGSASVASESRRTTLRDVEFEYPRDERLGVGQTLIEHVIPAGMPIAAARLALRTMGLRCRNGKSDALVKCTYSTFDEIEEHLQDVAWDVRLRSDHGVVREIQVERSDYGS